MPESASLSGLFISQLPLPVNTMMTDVCEAE
jgi:hypothetical protein